MEKKFNSQYSYDSTSVSYELNNLPSDTIPDQSLTIRDLLNGYQSGILPNVQMHGDYDDVNFQDDFLSSDSPLLDGVDDLTDRDLIKNELDVTRKKVDTAVDTVIEDSQEDI